MLSSRKLDGGNCIRYKNKYYTPVTRNGSMIYLKKGMTAMVIEAFDKTLYLKVLDQLFGLEEIPRRESKSKTFDLIEPKIKKFYIPPMSHPWKHASFQNYLTKQKHRLGANV